MAEGWWCRGPLLSGFNYHICHLEFSIFLYKYLQNTFGDKKKDLTLPLGPQTARGRVGAWSLLLTFTQAHLVTSGPLYLSGTLLEKQVAPNLVLP